MPLPKALTSFLAPSPQLDSALPSPSTSSRTARSSSSGQTRVEGGLNTPRPIDSVGSSGTAVGEPGDPFSRVDMTDPEKRQKAGDDDIRPALKRDLEMGNLKLEGEKLGSGSNTPEAEKVNSSIVPGLRSGIPLAKVPSKSSMKAKGSKNKKSDKSKTRFQTADPFRWTPSNVWTAVRSKLRNPSHPSSSSQIESAIGDGETASAVGSYLRPKSNRCGTGGTSSVGRTYSQGEEDDENVGLGSADGARGLPDPVAFVAVENDLGRFVPTAKSDNGSGAATGDGKASTTNGARRDSLAANANRMSTHEGGNGRRAGTETSTTQPSWVARMAQSGGLVPGNRDANGVQDDGVSIRRDRRRNPLKRTWVYEMAVERIWPAVAHFCDSKFPEPSKESSYLKEVHFTMRRGAIAAGVFYVIAWLLTSILMPKPLTPISIYGYMVTTGIFMVPIVVWVILDLVKTKPVFYQMWIWAATWSYPIIVIIDMWQCGFYTTHRSCGKKDFLALPVLALLALGQKRGYHLFGVFVWVVLVIVLLFCMDGSVPGLMYRNAINFLMFQGFLLMTSYLKEKGDRQLFSLRTQLKLQFRATQKAQVAEKKANALSRRFVSYIFHEVRVPLNTALLAVQNLDAENVYEHVDKDQRDMVDGLQSSLSLMEKVLNDVLSFNRMESGRFTQSRKPLDLHKCMQLVALAHTPHANASGLYLKTELDPEIDKLGGIFISDELRLRQVLSNLTSNSLKFTPSGGVTITSKLIWPRLAQFTPIQETNPDCADVNGDGSDGGATKADTSADGPFAPYTKAFIRGTSDKAIIRFEIKDTGVGLHPRDVKNGRLFSPYIQTEIGRRQGGKGTGLGLALCTQIVKLMGGRMGVDSQLGVGSTFWFEIALLLPPPSSHPIDAEPILDTAAKGFKRSTPAVHVSDKAYEPGTEALDDQLGISRPELTQMSSSLTPLVEADTPDSNQSGDPPLKPYELLPFQGEQVHAENVFDVIEDQVHTESLQQQYPAFAYNISLPDARYQESETSTMVRKDSEASQIFGGSSVPVSTVPSPIKARKDSVASDTNRTCGKEKEGKPPMKCLVVDDDAMTRKLMCRMLQRHGHTTEQAGDGQAAFEILRKRNGSDSTGEASFDIVFLDNQMPKMSGVECSREVRRAGIKVFICGATGNALSDDQTEYLEAGADKILTKPIKQASLLEALEEARLRVAGLTHPKGELSDNPYLST